MRRWIVIGLAVAVIALLALRGCMHPSTPPNGPDAAQVDARSTPRQAAVGALQDPAKATARNAALQSAIDVVQGYLEDLASARTAQADARWQGGRPSQREIEHGIRTQLPARAVQVRTLAPTGDANDVPRRVRVPARLRIAGADGVTRLYDGNYDVVREADGTWRIVDAEVHEAPATR